MQTQQAVLTDGVSPGVQQIDGEWFTIHDDGSTERHVSAADAQHAYAAKRQVALLSAVGGTDAPQTAA